MDFLLIKNKNILKRKLKNNLCRGNKCVNFTNLSDYRTKKLNKKILEDINNILLVLEKSQQALMFFKKYKPVQEIISIIETNKVLFQLKKKAYEKNSIVDKS